MAHHPLWNEAIRRHLKILEMSGQVEKPHRFASTGFAQRALRTIARERLKNVARGSKERRDFRGAFNDFSKNIFFDLTPPHRRVVSASPSE